MNKSTKGAIAAGAAAVLMLGGAGSLAYWNAEGDIAGGSITAGELKLTDPTPGAWTLNGSPVTSLSSVKVVPGDELEYTAGWDITATGDNLKAVVDVTGFNASGSLASAVTLTDTYLVGGTAPAGNQITSADDGETLAATLNVDFPFGTSADNSTQTLTLDLSDVKVALTQVQ
ncbi:MULTISPECIES: alternate-type signal peptide domain-containing protein [unclassified Aeromicrobium]|uniref:alternate-type signal peptide domain-containing protein n=1 Tax=unclassified Aeromicrobium TaxID=2633570 RepID=UPI00396B05BE